VVILLSVKLNN